MTTYYNTERERTKEERKEIYRDFHCNIPYWTQIGEDNFSYISWEDGIKLEIDPHIAIRCEDRSVSNDAIFLAIKVFCQSTGVCPKTGEDFIGINDVMPGQWIALTSKEDKLVIIFKFVGYDEDNNIVLLAKTVCTYYPGFRYRRDNVMFDIVSDEQGQFKIKWSDTKNVRYID
jgi:hypothetical protein